MNTVSFAGEISQFIEDCYFTIREPISSIDSSATFKYFNKELFTNFNPDINGYVFVFFVPPPFKLASISGIDTLLTKVQKFTTFAAIDFSPPQAEVVTSTITSRLGGVPFARDVETSNQLSVTYLDNNELMIYSFHYGWREYIKGVTEGFIPSGDFPESLLPDNDGEIEDGIDYMGSFFIVKYDPTFTTIKYIGKATGAFPTSTPSKELIGQRTSNELTTLPYTYIVTKYDEAMSEDHPIYDELADIISIF